MTTRENKQRHSRAAAMQTPVGPSAGLAMPLSSEIRRSNMVSAPPRSRKNALVGHYCGVDSMIVPLPRTGTTFGIDFSG